MAKVFWITGRSCAGKTTLAKKLERHLKDKMKVKVLDDKELQLIRARSGRKQFEWSYTLKNPKRLKKVILRPIKIILKQADYLSQSGVIVIIANAGNPRILEYAKKQLNGRCREIHLNCSIQCSLKRQTERINKRGFGFINNKIILAPKSPDITIDTERQSIEESFQTLLTFTKEELSLHS